MEVFIKIAIGWFLVSVAIAIVVVRLPAKKRDALVLRVVNVVAALGSPGKPPGKPLPHARSQRRRPRR